jgi:diaminopimelate decarboxylase
LYTWKELKKLLDKSDASAYIVNLDIFHRNVYNFLSAFRQIYKNTNIAYSYKTNYLPTICVEAKRLGLYAEVVSGMEYEIALACENSLDRIIFNGPLKTQKELEKALLGNSLVNIDSLDEISKVINICSRYPDRYFNVGLRCNFQIIDNWQSRFGLNSSDGQLDLAFKQISNLPNCSINGLHCHFSKDRSTLSYRIRTERMLTFVNRYFKDATPKYLNLGGGFYGNMPDSLQRQFGDSPSYEDYASEIAPLVAKEFGKDGKTQLILEPGIGIVGDVMQFVCTVASVKHFPDRIVAVTTGSFQNIKPSINSINLPIKIYSNKRKKSLSKNQKVDIVGYTCIEDDVLYYDYPMSVNVGDIIVFNNVGAYSIVFKPPFIRTMPPIVMPTEDGKWTCLKKRESVNRLLKLYIY